MQEAQPWNVGTCRCDDKREAQVRRPHESESSEAQHRGGAVRSSAEMPVMGMERRDCLMRLEKERQLETG